MALFNCCFCGKPQKGQGMDIGPPQLVKGPSTATTGLLRQGRIHSFRHKGFRRPRLCEFCREPINSQGSYCKVCGFVCHRTCELKVVTPCESPINRYEKHKSDCQTKARVTANNQFQYTKLESNHPLVRSEFHSNHSQGHKELHRPSPPKYRSRRDRDKQPRIEMDLTYITERILAVTFPAPGMDAIYRAHLKEVTRMLRTKHGDNYMVFNLSERRHDVQRMNSTNKVLEFGWPKTLAPPLERLCTICKSLDSWLSSNPQHIVVLHCKGGMERAGVVVAAYMQYSNICASSDQALDRFAMKRFYDDKIGGLSQPSQLRYIHYFAGLLSGAIQINSQPLYLQCIVITAVPNFDGKGGCKPFVKIYQSMQCVYSSGIYSITPGFQKVILTIEKPMQLRGDILVKCYSKKAYPALSRDVIFRCQFHTCAVSEYSLNFVKDDLDEACNDDRFPEEASVEFKFSSAPDKYQGNGYLRDVHIPVDKSEDSLVKWDSYDNFDLCPEDSPDGLEELDMLNEPVVHTNGPVDGSVYATVTKQPRPVLYPDHNANTNGPHSTSMDSGISSATSGQHRPNPSPPHSASLGYQPNASPGSGHFETNAEVHHMIPMDEQAKLDELLQGMLQDVESMPDIKGYRPGQMSPCVDTMSAHQPFPKPVKHVTYNLHTTTTTTRTPVPNKIPNGHAPHVATNGYHRIQEEDEDLDEPYHARHNSKPFSYGAVGSSPRFTRKQLEFSSSLKPTTPPPILRTASPSFRTSSPGVSFVSESPTAIIERPVTPTHPAERPITPVRAASPPRMLGQEYHVPLPAHMTSTPLPAKASVKQEPAEPNNLIIYYVGQRTEPGADWLKRQKQKLQQKREAQVFAQRNPTERRLLHELRTAQQKRFPHQQYQGDDGYVSDTFISAVKERHPYLITPLDEVEPVIAPPPKSIHPVQSVATCVLTPLHVDTNGYGAATKPPIHKVNGIMAPDSPLIPSRSSSREATLRSIQSTTSSSTITPQRAYGGGPSTPTLTRQKSDTSFDRERPFVAVKRSPNSGCQTPTLGGGRSSREGRPSSPGLNTQLDDLQSTLKSVSGGRYTPQEWSTADESKFPSQNSDRPETPAFPVHPRTPYANNDESPIIPSSSRLPPKSPPMSRKFDRSPSPGTLRQLRSGLPGSSVAHSASGQTSPPSVYFGQSERSSLVSLNDPQTVEVITTHPVIVKDTSKFWYKPDISREEAVTALKDKQPGSFVIRDSNSFQGAFGLALKVATPPPNVQNRSGDSTELVRHFLIEPAPKGVRLKGCANEPVFGSLSALVYQHLVTPLALPCKLILPDVDPVTGEGDGDVTDNGSTPTSSSQLLVQGAACNVLYLFTYDTESLTGPMAVRRAATVLLRREPPPPSTVVHFKVAAQGITITDNMRKLFFRRHYPVAGISHCSLDPDSRTWTHKDQDTGKNISTNRIFGFVARKHANRLDNSCHVFAELEPEQPASAIVNFVSKVMMSLQANAPKTNGVTNSVV